MPNSAEQNIQKIGQSSQWQSKSHRDIYSNRDLKYSSSLRSQELAEMLNFLSVMGIALTPSQVRRINEMKKRGLSGKKITTPSDQKSVYQLPENGLSGRWVRKDELQNQQVNYLVSPDKFPISLKRSFVDLALKISPIITNYFSNNSIDVIAIASNSVAGKLSDGNRKNIDDHISNAFAMMLRKDFPHQDLLINFFSDIKNKLTNDQEISGLSDQEKAELKLFLDQFDIQESQSQESLRGNNFLSPRLRELKPEISPQEVQDYVNSQRIYHGNSTIISLDQSQFLARKMVGVEEIIEIDYDAIGQNSTAKKFLDYIRFESFTETNPVMVVRDLDLRYVDLRAINIDSIRFENCNFANAIMPENSNNLQFFGCDLSHTKWSGNHQNLKIGFNPSEINFKIHYITQMMKSLQSNSNPYFPKLFPNGIRDEEKLALEAGFRDLILKATAQLNQKTSCQNADFSGCVIDGINALNVGFKGANFQNTSLINRIYDSYIEKSIELYQCEGLELQDAKFIIKKSSNPDQDVVLKGMSTIDFSDVGKKYELLFGPEYAQKLKQFYTLSDQFPTELIEKIRNNQKIYIKVSSQGVDDSIVKGLSDANQVEVDYVQYYGNNATTSLISKAMEDYLKKYYEGFPIEIVGDDFKGEVDSVLNIGFFGKPSKPLPFSNVMTSSFGFGDIIITKEGAIMIDIDSLSNSHDSFSKNKSAIALTQNPASIEMRSTLEELIYSSQIPPISVVDPQKIQEFNSFITLASYEDSASILVDSQLKIIKFNPSKDQILPFDYHANQMKFDAISGVKIETPPQDLVTNISQFSEVKNSAEVISQRFNQGLNVVNIDQEIVSQCDKISIHNAQNIFSYCYLELIKNCVPSSVLQKNDRVILFELKDKSLRLLLISGGQKEITIAGEKVYQDQSPAVETTIQQSSSLAKESATFQASDAVYASSAPHQTSAMIQGSSDTVQASDSAQASVPGQTSAMIQGSSDTVQASSPFQTSVLSQASSASGQGSATAQASVPGQTSAMIQGSSDTVQVSAAHQTSAMIQESSATVQGSSALGQKSSSNPQSTPLPITIHESPENKIQGKQKNKAVEESNQNLLYLIILAPVISAVCCYLRLKSEGRLEARIYNQNAMAEIVVGERGNEHNQGQSQNLASNHPPSEWVSFNSGDEEESPARPNSDPLSRSNSSSSSSSSSSLASRRISSLGQRN